MVAVAAATVDRAAFSTTRVSIARNRHLAAATKLVLLEQQQQERLQESLDGENDVRARRKLNPESLTSEFSKLPLILPTPQKVHGDDEQETTAMATALLIAIVMVDSSDAKLKP